MRLIACRRKARYSTARHSAMWSVRTIARCIALLLAASVVIVPSVMRAKQRVDLRDSTRLSIRLNWQSDAPPQKQLLAPTAIVVAVPAPAGRLVESDYVSKIPLAPPADGTLPNTAFDNAPDLFRGPPSRSL
jgi:hypothetical protein